MKSSMEALAEKCGRNAIAQGVTMVLVLGLWAANVYFSQHKATAVPPAPEEHIAIAEAPAPADGGRH